MTADLQTTYRKAGFEGSFRLGTRPVVLVVDLSRGFTDPECPLGSDLDAVVEANVRLLAAARAHDVPAIFSTIAFTDAEADSGVWLQKVPNLATLMAGSPWT